MFHCSAILGDFQAHTHYQRRVTDEQKMMEVSCGTFLEEEKEGETGEEGDCLQGGEQPVVDLRS